MSDGLPSRRRFAANVAAGLAVFVAPPPVRALAATCSRSPRVGAGPFYRAGAPARSELAANAAAGDPLRVSGRILSASACAPLAGAVLDVWHANSDGVYDLRGFVLRGKVRTDGDGTFDFSTIVPGRYATRPAHIHVLIRAPGARPLSTQLYFEGDTRLARDPLVHSQLVGAVKVEGGQKRVRYQLVL